MTTSGLQTHDFLMRLKKAEDNLPPLPLELAGVMRRMVEEIERPQLQDIQGLQAELRRLIGGTLSVCGISAAPRASSAANALLGRICLPGSPMLRNNRRCVCPGWSSSTPSPPLPPPTVPFNKGRPWGSHTRLLSEKYFQVRRMVSQRTKIRRGRLTRHSWCVRRTLRREITFLSADWY